MTTIGVRGSNPVWYFVDLFGKQFDDTFWLYVLENVIPYNFSAPFHDPSMTIPWTDPIQFLSNGTLPIDIYFDPAKVYRLEFRENVGPLPPSQDDPLIYLVENYVPTGAGIMPPNMAGSTTDNQIANGQFPVFNFTTPLNLVGVSNPPPIELAPGWFLDLTGTGNALIERIPLNTTISTPTNAPYALHIMLTGGWTGQPTLRQRFSQNGQNWQGKFISTSFTARVAGAQQTIVARLDASNNQPLVVLKSAFLSNLFVEYQGVAQVPIFVNLDVPPDAYLDYKILLPSVIDLYITSIQVTESGANALVPYQEDTIDRQIDHLFHYYEPLLVYKPIPSYLVGWAFSLNPAQIFGDSIAANAPPAIGINKSKYVWDQTIVFQSADDAITTARGADGSLHLSAAVATQMAVIQYLDQTEARKLLSDRMAVHIAGYTSLASLGGKVTIWATSDANLPNINTGTNNSLVSAIDATGRVTADNGAWTEVTRPGLGDAFFSLQLVSPTNSNANDIDLFGWDFQGNALANTATYFAIVIGFSPMSLGSSLNLISVSLCAGDIATRPAPKTLGATLLDCQRYFWSTFPVNTAPQTALGINSGFPTVQRLITGTGGTLLEIDLPAPMRTQSTVVYYNPVSANNQARNLINAGGEDCTSTALFNAAYDRRKTLITSIADNNGGTAFTDVYGVHITADARLGIVN